MKVSYQNTFINQWKIKIDELETIQKIISKRQFKKFQSEEEIM